MSEIGSLLSGPARKRVLVIDQTYADASIEGGLADGSTFSQNARRRPRARIPMPKSS